jgi:Na+/phosphate symporter
MKGISAQLTSYQQELANAIDDLIEMVNLAHEGFIRHQKPLLVEAEKLGKKVHDFEKDYTERLLREANKEDLKLFLALAAHVERIGDCTEAVIRTVQTKVREGTLFSDKAVAELRQVFDSTKDLLRNIKDVVVTRNVVLLEHVLGCGDRLGQAAAEFSTAHEERLIAGVCQPKHSSIYLDIMDNLRTSGWHVKEMATKLKKA